MRLLCAYAFLLILTATTVAADDIAAFDRASLRDFQRAVYEYANLRDRTAEQIGQTMPRASPQEIEAFRSALAIKMASLRLNAQPGNILSPNDRFLRVVRCILSDPMTVPVEPPSLDSSQQVALNQRFLDDVAPGILPARVMIHLPDLPMGLTYRIRAERLVLRDMIAGLVVDYIPEPVIGPRAPQVECES